MEMEKRKVKKNVRDKNTKRIDGGTRVDNNKNFQS